MMGLDSLGLGSTGSMGKSIMSIIGIGISAIILLTFAPNISGSVSGISLTGKDGGYCQLKGEAMERVSVKAAANTDKADKVWAQGGHVKLVDNGGVCNTASALEVATYYTPQGEKFTGVASEVNPPGGEWEAQSESLQAGGLGTLIQLLFGVMGLLIPAGALGYLGNVGTQLVSDKLGGGMGTSILVVVVSVVVIGAILPQIIEPMDTFFLAMDGNRYYIFDVGLGKIAGTISNFFGIALIAGLISLGMMMWKGRSSGGSGSYA